jgi:hypothetical protein
MDRRSLCGGVRTTCVDRRDGEKRTYRNVPMQGSSKHSADDVIKTVGEQRVDNYHVVTVLTANAHPPVAYYRLHCLRRPWWYLSARSSALDQPRQRPALHRSIQRSCTDIFRSNRPVPCRLPVVLQAYYSSLLPISGCFRTRRL